MARKVCHIVLMTLLASTHLGAGAPDSWSRQFTADINDRTREIQEWAHNFSQNIHEQMQDLRAQIEQTVANSVGPALAEADRLIKNLPQDSQGRIITSSGSSNIIINSNGMSRRIMSGRTSDGEPYIRDIIEEYIDGNLYHNETTYNPKTNATERIRWKLDLTTPGAKPEILTDEK